MRLVGLLLLVGALPTLAGCGTTAATGHALDTTPVPATTSARPATVLPEVLQVDPPVGTDDVRVTPAGFDPATVFAPTGQVVSFRRDRDCTVLYVQGMGRFVLGSGRDAAFRFDEPGRYRITDPDGDAAVVVVTAVAR